MRCWWNASWTAKRGIALVAVMLAAAGCENKQTKEKLAQLTTVSAEKDSLLAMMAENTKVLSDISTELAKVREIRRPVGAVKASESPLASSVSYRDSIRNKITDVVARLNAAESRLHSEHREIVARHHLRQHPLGLVLDAHRRRHQPTADHLGERFPLLLIVLIDRIGVHARSHVAAVMGPTLEEHHKLVR